ETSRSVTKRRMRVLPVSTIHLPTSSCSSASRSTSSYVPASLSDTATFCAATIGSAATAAATVSTWAAGAGPLGRVAVLAHRGNSIDRLADSNPFDLAALPRQQLVDELLVLVGHSLDADPAIYDLSFRDRELLFVKRDHDVADVVRGTNLVGVGGHGSLPP